VGHRSQVPLEQRPVWAEFQRSFHDWTGIRLAQSAASTAADLLHQRADALGEDVDSYVESLSRFDRLAERRLLIDALVVNTTWFMREEQGLMALADALTDIAKGLSEPRPLKVWCAGCSSGQEPYGLAILLEQAGVEAEIVATDISESVLKKARGAEYTEAEVRSMSRLVRSYAPKVPGGETYRMSDAIRSRVTFELHNLARPPHAPMKYRPLDAIVCRNLLIYFDRQLAVDIVDQFGAALNQDQGFVLLGAAEQPLVWLSKRLQPVLTYAGTLLRSRNYGRPIEMSRGVMRTGEFKAASPGQSRPTSPPRRRRKTREIPYLPARLSDVVAADDPPAPKPPRPKDRLFPVDVRQTMEAARRAHREGDQERGLELVDAVLARDRLIAEAHLLRGLMLKEQGRTKAATEALRNARFLSGDDAWMAPYQLGLVLEVTGDHPGAREAYRHAIVVIDAGGTSGMRDADFDDVAFAPTVAAACRARLASLKR